MALRGARVAMLPETERGAHLNERLIKSITGGDKIIIIYPIYTINPKSIPKYSA